MDQGLWAPRMGATLLGVSIAGLILATIGIYGVMAHSVLSAPLKLASVCRSGADRMQVLKMILGRGMLITLVGAALGVIAFLFLAPVVAKTSFGVSGARSHHSHCGTLLLAKSRCRLLCPRAPRHAPSIGPIIALRYE